MEKTVFVSLPGKGGTTPKDEDKATILGTAACLFIPFIAFPLSYPFWVAPTFEEFHHVSAQLFPWPVNLLPVVGALFSFFRGGVYRPFLVTFFVVLIPVAIICSFLAVWVTHWACTSRSSIRVDFRLGIYGLWAVLIANVGWWICLMAANFSLRMK